MLNQGYISVTDIGLSGHKDLLAKNQNVIIMDLCEIKLVKLMPIPAILVTNVAESAAYKNIFIRSPIEACSDYA